MFNIKEFSENMCTKLYCRKTLADGSCWTTGIVQEGSVCASGSVKLHGLILSLIFLNKTKNFKICKNGQCVTDTKAPVNNCIFGDNRITANQLAYTNLINIPAAMTCPQTISYLLQNNKDIVNFCSNYKGQCCASCESNS